MSAVDMCIKIREHSHDEIQCYKEGKVMKASNTKLQIYM